MRVSWRDSIGEVGFIGGLHKAGIFEAVDHAVGCSIFVFICAIKKEGEIDQLGASSVCVIFAVAVRNGSGGVRGFPSWILTGMNSSSLETAVVTA